MLYFKIPAMGYVLGIEMSSAFFFSFSILSVNKEALNSGNPQLHKQDEPTWKPVKLTGPGQGEVSIEFCLSSVQNRCTLLWKLLFL